MKIKKHLFIVILTLAITNAIGQTREVGIASYYGDEFQGRTTANGEKFDQNKFTAAHKTLPFDTKVKVTHLSNGKSVVVRINDRGPFVKGRIIDLSKVAAQEIGLTVDGTAKVEVQKVSDDVALGDVSKRRTKNKSKNIVGLTYYNYRYKEIKPNGFGVQLLSLSDKSNAIDKAKELQEKHDCKIIIQSTNKGVYRLIAGEFNNKRHAQKLQRQLKRDFKDCFIIEY